MDFLVMELVIDGASGLATSVRSSTKITKLTKIEKTNFASVFALSGNFAVFVLICFFLGVLAACRFIF
jgi:hypothetical protein